MHTLPAILCSNLLTCTAFVASCVRSTPFAILYLHNSWSFIRKNTARVPSQLGAHIVIAKGDIWRLLPVDFQ